MAPKTGNKSGNMFAALGSMTEQYEKSKKERDAKRANFGTDDNVERVEVEKDKAIVEIEVSMIDEDPSNTYIFGMDNIDELVTVIEEEGFHGAIEVYKKENGRYMLASGGRRLEAYKKMRKHRIPCIILQKKETRAEEIRVLISSNTLTRELTTDNWVKATQVLLGEVYTKEWQKKQHENGESGDANAACAKILGKSLSAVKRYVGLSKLDKELYALITIPGFPATAFENVQTLSKTLQRKLAKLLLVDRSLEDYVSGEYEYPLSKTDIMKTIASLKKLEQTKEIDEEAKRKSDSIKAFKNMNKNLVKIGNTIESYVLMLEEDESLLENSDTTTEDIDLLIEKLQKLKSRL